MSLDWKKQFYRVKQQTAQNLGRAEKSEVLSDDLMSLERRIEATRLLCLSTIKRAQASLISQNAGDVDKRMKKTPTFALYTSLQESVKLLGDESLTGQMVLLTSEAQRDLVTQLVRYEITIEQSVISPLQNLVDNEIFKIQKLRKQLTKLTLDMDSVTNRLSATQRQANSSGNIASYANKAEKIQEEHDDVCNRVQTVKDHLSTEMYQFVILENKVSDIYENFIRDQMEYHRSCLDVLAQTLPEMNERQKVLCQQSVYGQSLKQHLKHTNRDIATVIELCVCTIIEVGMKEEGLFRINGSVSRLKKLRAALNCNRANMQDYVRDLPCVASALKQYMRELPDPLMTFDLYEQWVQAAYIQNAEDKLQAFTKVISLLPKANFDNLRYVIKFFAKFVENAEFTKMNVNNISIVIGPNLLYTKDEDAQSQMFKANVQAHVVDYLITNSDVLFPGDIEFMDSSDGSPYSTLSSVHDLSYEDSLSISGDQRPSILNQVNVVGMATAITSLDSSMDSRTSSSNASPTTGRKSKKQAPAPPAQKPVYPTISPCSPSAKTMPQSKQTSSSTSSSSRPPSNPDANRLHRPVAPPPAPPKPTTSGDKPATSPKPKFTSKSSNPFDFNGDEEEISSNTNL